MLDIQFIRQNPDLIQTAARNKNVAVDIKQLLQLDGQRRDLLGEIESLRAERNELAGSAKGGKPDEAQIARGKALKAELAKLEDKLAGAEAAYRQLMLQVPNVPTADTPVGKSEDENVVVKTVGEKPQFDFEPQNHWQLAEARSWIDKERAAKVAGARFAYIKGDLVRLWLALVNFGFQILGDEAIIKKIVKDNNLAVSSKPFTPVLPPFLIRTEMYEGTARLDGEEQTYKLADDDLWLNASAEHSICPMYAGEIIDAADLPIRYLGLTTAFRREAGTYGKDMEGIFRLHQFDKQEMQSFATPEAALDEHLLMVAIQEYLMQQLGLPYQVLLKCTADIGMPNARGVDINTWLPGQDRYRETHTADYIGDFQARRLQTRLRRADGSLELVHTNDATAFSQRPLIAILENYQTKDGRVRIPAVLQPLIGKEEI